MKKHILSVFCLMVISSATIAQGFSPSQLSINYNIGAPVGDFSNYISPATFRGMAFQYDYFLTDKVSIGGYLGWNGFFEKKAAETYEFNEGDVGYAINGTRYNYFYALPILLKGQYRFVDAGQILPYGAMGIGTYYTEGETYVGAYGFKDRKWTFGMAPELGTLVNLGQSGWAFKLAATYHISFYNQNNMNTVTYLGLNFGFNYDF